MATAFKRLLICNSSHRIMHNSCCVATQSSYLFCTKNDSNEKEKEKETDVNKENEKKEENSFFSQIEQSWNKAKQEMERQQVTQQNIENEHSTNDNLHNEWIAKYNQIILENKFVIELDFKAQLEYLSIAQIKNPMYRWGMNSWVTGFSDRFLFYEEFMCGVIDGFKYIVECLEKNEFDALKDCFVSQVYHHIEQLTHSLVNGGHTLDKCSAHIYNIRVDREKIDYNQLLQQQDQEQQLNTPVQLFFDVKYYCQFIDPKQNKHYKIIDVLWHAKYVPISGQRLKYEISSPWTISHVTVSVINYN
eukprot:461352_1